jgi:hypothetical protein
MSRFYHNLRRERGTKRTKFWGYERVVVITTPPLCPLRRSGVLCVKKAVWSGRRISKSKNLVLVFLTEAFHFLS